MKAAIYLALGLLCLAAAPTVHAVGEQAILDFLEELRGRMCHPIPKWNLPALDPFEIAHVEVEANTDVLIDFNASLTNFKLTGLSDFVVNDLVLSPIAGRTSVINVTLPLTAFKSQYTCYGSLAYVLYLSGHGDAEASMDKLTLAISFILNTTGKIGIRNLKVEISIGSIFVKFDYLFEEPRINDFMHALINELGLELMHDIWEVEQEVVEAKIEDRLNLVLGQYTVADIVEIIAGGGSGSGDPIFGPNDPPADCKTRTLHPLLSLKEQLRKR